MATREEVWKNFGMAAEAAQLSETQLGTLLLTVRGMEERLFVERKPELARDILGRTDASALGTMLKEIAKRVESPEVVENFFSRALSERNRLIHHFFREHGSLINTEEGRDSMIAGLEMIHETIFNAYKAALLVSGIDLDKLAQD